MEPSKAGLSQFGEAVRDSLESESNAAEQIRMARAELLRRVTAPGSRRGALGFSGWLSPARVVFAIALGLSGFAVWLWLTRPISFQVGVIAASGRLGEVVQAPDSAPVALHFSEGSELVLHEAARVRVLSVEPTGAHVLLESGRADVAIAHRFRLATRWRFEAGPFHVLVTGTRFSVSWSSSGQALVLTTSEGSVQVSGSCLDLPRAVRAGDSVRLSCAPPTEASPRAPAPTASATLPLALGLVPSAQASVAPARRSPLERGPSSSTASPTTSPSASADDGFRAALKAGRLSEALLAAESADFAGICERASHSELLALGDAARLSGRSGLAAEALLALRRRFPRSFDAATAAFILGRIAFDQRGDYADAARWFRAYLDELPKGPLMGDAAGRLLEARIRQGDRSRARLEAEQYLKRFPSGPYAAAARKILAE